MCVCACLCMCVCVNVHGYTQGVQRITAIKPLPIHDMSDIIIHPRKTQVQTTSNGTLFLLLPLLLVLLLICPHLSPIAFYD